MKGEKMVSSELVKPALFFIILMVSLSKCEIDSATAKVQPDAFPLLTTSNGGAKTTHSLSSSSFSTSQRGVVAVVLASPTLNNDTRTSIERERRQHQSSGAHNNFNNIISSTSTPAMAATLASPILTSLQAEKQEVGGREVAQVERLQQHHRFEGNNNNKQESSSSSSFLQTLSRQREKMTGIGTRVPVQTAIIAVGEEPSKTFSRNSSPSPRFFPSFASLPRREIVGTGTVIPPDNIEKELLSPFRYEANPDSSPIPRHTWIPAGLAFSCKNRVPGYYADASEIAKCQVYHMCMMDGRKYSMLCGIGTVFNQLTFVCDHWYNYKCSDAEDDYKINSQLWEDFIGDDDDNDEVNRNDDQVSDGDVVQQTSSQLFRPSHLSETRRSLS